MSEKKEYRNAVRSRNLIRQAFLQLLTEKPFEKITATDIINRADINRSTFYAHYPDARGLMDEIVDQILSMFQNMLSSIDFGVFFENPRPILNEVIAFLQDNQELYKLLSKSSMATPVLERLKRVLIRQVLECPALPVQTLSQTAISIRVRILMGGLIDTYRQWLDGEFECSLEEAADEIVKLIQTMAKDV